MINDIRGIISSEVYRAKNTLFFCSFSLFLMHIWTRYVKSKTMKNGIVLGEFGSYRIWVRHMRNVRAVFPFAPHVLCYDSFHLCYVSVSPIGSKEAKLNSHLHFSFLTIYISLDSKCSIPYHCTERIFDSLSLSLSLSLYIYIYKI